MATAVRGSRAGFKPCNIDATDVAFWAFFATSGLADASDTPVFKLKKRKCNTM
jgi:hypothetical protein